MLLGIDWNIEGQQKFLEELKRKEYYKELLNIPLNQSNNELEFYINNGYFEAGDAEVLYQVIRMLKPKK